MLPPIDALFEIWPPGRGGAAAACSARSDALLRELSRFDVSLDDAVVAESGHPKLNLRSARVRFQREQVFCFACSLAPALPAHDLSGVIL
jgi:hypothetical protein